MAANQNRPSLQMFEQVFPSLRGAEYSTLKQYLEDGKSVFPLVEKGVPGLVADFGLTPTDAQRFLQRANALAIYVRRQFIEQRLYGADTEVAKPSSGLLSIVEGPSFERLFDVGFNTLCPPDALESVASPVAYLVDLMKWIDRIESVPDEDVKPKMPLNARRTDLARLPIDFNAVHQAVSAVDIILAKLETFIEDHTDGPDDFDVNEAMSTARYPNGLPYYQAWVTLDYVARQNALSVGDVTRAVDQAFPYFLQPEAWAADGGRAMLHASRLGPYQRELLTEDPFDSDDRERFYWLNFGTDARGLDWQNISQVPFFCERTKLEALQLEALLSLRSFAPVRSANALPLDDAPSGAQSGSVYLNAGNTPAVDINSILRRSCVGCQCCPESPPHTTE
ncbi:Tc toxin subunit A [Pseudomonas frederiksbergensis]|uniref:Tc toxin subunit A n=1 Tax=Pseudomonas frederiksbergensis TaxID=104087 RepID=UPI003D1A8E9A